MKEYKNRIADRILADKLEAMGAVLIEGPKYCGKTTLAVQQAKSILFMADPDTKSQNLALAQTNMKRLLQGDTPRLIDEWQLSPQFRNIVQLNSLYHFHARKAKSFISFQISGYIRARWADYVDIYRQPMGR